MAATSPRPTVRPTLVLFDVDSTLVNTGGAGRRAMVAAFVHLHGRSDACDAIPMGGMTDRAIVRAGLRAIGHADDVAHLDAMSAAYLAALPHEVARSPQYRVLPGVPALLDALAGLPHVALGLGTGNVEQGARIKLQRGGLADRFAFGGFGCDGEARADLVAAGIARGLQRLGVARAQCRVVVVGDTPADVAAALHNGAECLGVATGSHGEAQLEAAGATCTAADLAQAGVGDWLAEADQLPRYVE